MSNDDDEIKPPKVTGSPEQIWLIYGDIDRDCTHAECSQHGDVTWCEDSVFSSDVKYVRADTLEAQSATIAEQAREIEALRADAERYRWLRDEDDDPVCSLRQLFTMTGKPKDVDAAVDAAMRKAVTP